MRPDSGFFFIYQAMCRERNLTRHTGPKPSPSQNNNRACPKKQSQWLNLTAMQIAKTTTRRVPRAEIEISHDHETGAHPAYLCYHVSSSD